MGDRLDAIACSDGPKLCRLPAESEASLYLQRGALEWIGVWYDDGTESASGTANNPESESC